MPATFQLKRANGTVVQVNSLPLWLTPTKGSATTAVVDESLYGDPATSGTTYRWAPTLSSDLQLGHREEPGELLLADRRRARRRPDVRQHRAPVERGGFGGMLLVAGVRCRSEARTQGASLLFSIWGH